MWTENEIEILKNYYPISSKEEISNLLVNHSIGSIYAKASSLGIKKEFWWSEHDINIVKTMYLTNDMQTIQGMLEQYHPACSITEKANEFGLTKHKFWTNEEIAILRDNYSEMTVDEICKLLPNRKRKNIIMKAMTLGLKTNIYWKEEETQFLIDNWEIMSDYEIAIKLNKKQLAVKTKRKKLNLFRKKTESEYDYTLTHFIRTNIGEWKKSSMEKCNYQCVITGDKNYEIHHLINVATILKEALDNLNLSRLNKTYDYNEQERIMILDEFKKVQSKYPLGICIREDLHVLFHSLYGQCNNTPEQFYHFIEEYKKGTFKSLNIESVTTTGYIW